MFTDISTLPQFSQVAINYLAKAEISQGIGGGLYAPGTDVTREQMALFLYRIMHWAKLLADDLADVSVHIIYFTSSGVSIGSGWWIAPQYIMTGKHVVTETLTRTTSISSFTKFKAYFANVMSSILPKSKLFTDMKVSATTEIEAATTTYEYCGDYNILLRGVAGMIRWDVMGQPRPHVIWTTKAVDPTDLAVIMVDYDTWMQYVALRESMGLKPQTFLKLPPEDRQPQQGEPVAAFGSPLMYEATLSTGIVANGTVPKLVADGVYQEYFSVTAGINPGNSGGLVVSADKDVLGMALLKPWYASYFGWTGADDIGLALKHQEITKWIKRRNITELLK